MNKLNPWHGLLTYEEGNPQYPFCGREIAISELRKIVDNNLVCTLYGKSGVGKSSLLKAGLFPLMRENGYLPIYIRLKEISSENGFWPDIIEHIKKEAEKNQYSFQITDNPNNAYDYFANMVIRQDNGNGDIVFPIIVFDQFEESLIGCGDDKNNGLERFLTELYDIIEPGLRDDIYNLRIIFSIREDDLYLFEDCIDNLNLNKFKEIRYRLHQMSRDEAKEVILRPGKKFFEQSQDDIYCKKLLSLAKTDIVGEERYDVLMLSLVCSQLYDFAVKRGHDVISVNDLNDFSQNDPLSEFYSSIRFSLSEHEINYLETHLVDATGRRKLLLYDEFKTYLPPHLLKETSTNNDSKNHAILQTININHAVYVELIHDRLAKAIATKREARLLEKERRSKFNMIKWGCVALILCLSLFVVWKSIEHSVINSIDGATLSEQEDVFVDSLPLRIGIFEKFTQEMVNGEWTSVDINFFNPYCFSFGNIVYYYEDLSSYKIMKYLSSHNVYTYYRLDYAEKIILPYDFHNTKIPIGPETRHLVVLYNPDSINVSISEGAKCELYVPYGTLHRLLGNDYVIAKKFYKVHELSIINTWWLRFKWDVVHLFHCRVTISTGMQVIYSPFYRIVFYIFILLIIPLLFTADLRVRYRKKGEHFNFVKTYISNVSVVIFVWVCNFLLHCNGDVSAYMPFFCAITVSMVMYIGELYKIVTKIEALFVFHKIDGSLIQLDKKIGRLTYNCVLFLLCFFLFSFIYFFKLTDDSTILFTYVPLIVLIIMFIRMLRCHDLGRNGWYQFIPGYWFVLMFWTGKQSRIEKNDNEISKMSQKDYNLVVIAYIVVVVLFVLILLCGNLEYTLMW